MISKKLLSGAALAALGIGIGGTAHAQSTGTQQVEERSEIVVTGTRGPRNLEGLITADSGAKARTVITQEFIATQTPGQTIAQTLNLAPGYNFTSDDAYGSTGGNVRIRGLDNQHVGLLIDGVPLNDAGNYSIYTNQQLDPELIGQANVNASSADVDSATASSTGGTINYTTLATTAEPGGYLQQTFGEFSYSRTFGLLQTGELGPFGTSAWLSGAYARSEKFKGPGNTQKLAVNFRVYQPLSGNDFVSVTGNWNSNRNDFYYNANLGMATGFCDVARTRVCLAQVETSPLGWDIDYPDTWVAPTVRAGVADTVPATNSAVQGFYGLKINPSDTGTLRGSSRFDLTDNITLTFDPSFNFTMANGGGTTNVNESGSGNVSSAQLRGFATTYSTCRVGTTLTGKDLNGDGDCMDTVQVYSPSNTNTLRWGANTSLIWNLSDTQLVRFAYAWDYGRTRQTGEWNSILSSGFPAEVFSGKSTYGSNPIIAADGTTIVQKRDRFSIATLNQPSAEYRGKFFDNALSVNLGIRAPFLTRDLNQFCYTQATATSTVFCTTEVATTQANGTVRFASQGTTAFYKPYSVTKKYDKILPSAGATYRFGSSQFFGSYSEQQSAPKVDNLYTLNADGTIGKVEPEQAKTFDFGYRYQTGAILLSASGYNSTFSNRIVSTRDPVDDTIIDRNVGDVKIWGVDAQAGWRVFDPLFLFASASYNNSEVQNDLFVSTAVGYAPLKGKELVETPNYMFSGRAEYDLGIARFGFQGKYVGERWITDVNDLKVPEYTVFDLDASWKLDEYGLKGSMLQLNVTNIFNERYYASLKGTQTSSTPGAPGGPASSTTGVTGNAFAAIGAPRAISVTLRAAF